MAYGGGIFTRGKSGSVGRGLGAPGRKDKIKIVGGGGCFPTWRSF